MLKPKSIPDTLQVYQAHFIMLKAMQHGSMVNDNHTNALTRAQAHRLVKQYTHLAGKPYYENDELLGIVECVAISPHDGINKWLFIHYYADCCDPQKALHFYHVPFFDAILIIQPQFCDSPIYRNLSTYLKDAEKQKTV